jgi:hypothetical protein
LQIQGLTDLGGCKGFGPHQEHDPVLDKLFSNGSLDDLLDSLLREPFPIDILFFEQLRPLPHHPPDLFSLKRSPYCAKSFLRIRIKIKGAELPHLFHKLPYDLGKPLSFARGDPIEKDSLGSNARHLKQFAGQLDLLLRL